MNGFHSNYKHQLVTAAGQLFSASDTRRPGPSPSIGRAERLSSGTDSGSASRLHRPSVGPHHQRAHRDDPHEQGCGNRDDHAPLE